MGCTCSKQQPKRPSPQVADRDERRPSIIMKLFSRKKTMAVEENLEPAISQAEFFNEEVNIGESDTGSSPTPSEVEEATTPVVLRSQLDVNENNEPPVEPPGDAIPAEEPPAEELPTEVGPDGCAFYGRLYLNVPPATETGEFGERMEVKAYLPCGHAFGHRCLNRYMQALKYEGTQSGETQPGETQPRRCCPWGNCIPLRYRCGHMCTPQRTLPGPLDTITINNAKRQPVLIGFCEFCLSEEGHSICQRIGKHRARMIRHRDSCASSSSFLKKQFYKASTKYFQKRQRREEKNLDKAVMAHEHSRAKSFYDQWLRESRRSKESRTQTSSRNSQTQGCGTKDQPPQDDQLSDNRPEESQSREIQENSQARDSQISDHSRTSSDVSNNLSGDSQPEHNQAGSLKESEHSTTRQADEVGQADQTPRGDEGEGNAKTVEYGDPIPGRLPKKAISIP
ncbi:hypothetical protein NCS52_01189300 [Fusarium sp. LHS14.1]|nr:hypothetical protein NCS52_01189300 [Fusarium sp. LHS14.1]